MNDPPGDDPDLDSLGEQIGLMSIEDSLRPVPPSARRRPTGSAVSGRKTDGGYAERVPLGARHEFGSEHLTEPVGDESPDDQTPAEGHDLTRRTGMTQPSR